MIPRDHIPWTALPVLKNPQKGFNHLTMKNAAFQAPEFPYVLYNNSKKKALIKKVKSCGSILCHLYVRGASSRKLVSNEGGPTENCFILGTLYLFAT